jgi:hypothetical protein
MKAVNGEIDVDNVFENLNNCFQLAKDLKITDLIDPSSKQLGEVAELVYRLQNCPELEIIDDKGFEA